MVHVGIDSQLLERQYDRHSPLCIALETEHPAPPITEFTGDELAARVKFAAAEIAGHVLAELVECNPAW